MTRFHTKGEGLKSLDPFDETEADHRIVITPVQTTEYPTARVLAAAFWLSYFTLHWLLLLEIIEPTWQRFGATLFFFAVATLLSINITAKKYYRGRKNE